MKRFGFSASIVTLAFAILLDSGTPVMAQSGNVVYYTARGSKLSKAFIKAFNKQYPNIKVDVIGAGSGELFTRIRAEKDNPRGDVAAFALDLLAADPSLFLSYKSKHHDAFPSWGVGPDNKFYGYSVNVMAFIVNTKEISSAEVPKSWKALSDPKYKGKIIMSNPSMSGSAYNQLAGMLELHGWDYVGKLVDNTVFTPKSRMVYQQVSRGEMPLGITLDSRAAETTAKGFPTKIVYPSEGAILGGSGVAIIKGGPNPENAKIFFDWHNSKEAHELGVSVKKSRVFRTDVAAPGSLDPLASLKMYQYDGKVAASQRDAYIDKFNELFAKKR